MFYMNSIENILTSTQLYIMRLIVNWCFLQKWFLRTEVYSYRQITHPRNPNSNIIDYASRWIKTHNYLHQHATHIESLWIIGFLSRYTIPWSMRHNRISRWAMNLVEHTLSLIVMWLIFIVLIVHQAPFPVKRQ